MFNKIRTLLIGVVLFLVGSVILNDYLFDSNKERRIQVAQLVESGEKIMGSLSDSFEERTTKILNGRKKSYVFKYTFEIEGQVYTGEAVFKEKPTATNVEVVYLKGDPSINAYNPEETLDELIESQRGFPWFGAVIFGLGLLISINGIKSFSK